MGYCGDVETLREGWRMISIIGEDSSGRKWPIKLMPVIRAVKSDHGMLQVCIPKAMLEAVGFAFRPQVYLRASVAVECDNEGKPTAIRITPAPDFDREY
jgi:hypothetical protein